MRLPTETTIAAVDYLDGDQVTLTLSRPNVSITLHVDEAHDPQTVAWRIRTTFGGRHECHGRAFDDLTRGRGRKRWEDLWEVAPIGFDGMFPVVGDGPDHTLEEVLSHAV